MDGVLSLTAHIVSAHVSKNDMSANELPILIQSVHQTLATIGQTVAEPQKAKPAVSAMKSVFPNHIVCLDCGLGVKVLKRHIKNSHNLTFGVYLEKWGLPPSYPMVAPVYAAQRSQFAKDRWSGRKAPIEPAPKKRGRPAKGK